MNGIRKYKKIYREEIENNFNELYKSLKRKYISNEERLERLKDYADNKLDHFGELEGAVTNKWVGKDSYILSKKVEYKIWKKINEDNHKIFGIGWGNFITKKELEDLKTLINDGDGNYKNLIKWDEKLMDLATKESLCVDIDNNFKYYIVSVKENSLKKKEVFVEDYYESKLGLKSFPFDLEDKEVEEFKPDKGDVIRFFRDRDKILKALNESYNSITRWLNVKYNYTLDREIIMMVWIDWCARCIMKLIMVN